MSSYLQRIMTCYIKNIYAMFKTAKQGYLPLFWILIFNCLVTPVKPQKLGQSCVVQLTGRQGICKEATYCRKELELAKIGLHLTFCQKQGNKYIICCTDNVKPVANPFSLPDNSYDTSDTLIFTDDSNDAPASRRRISEQKCIEYGKIFTETVQVIPLVTNPRPVSVNVAKCDNSISLIVGGHPARPGEFPHMAALGYRTDQGIDWKCGGTLISEEFVLTAAHCAKGQSSIVRVRLGEINLSVTKGTGEEVGVAQVIVHPQYRPPQKYNDIALVRLSQPVTLSRFIAPACLGTRFYIPETKAQVTGWGKTDFAGSGSEGLMKVVLNIVNNNECNKYYTNIKRVLPDGIRTTMLCAGELLGGKDACQGDSGGPLQVAHKDNPCLFNIIGVTSFGKGCANPNTLGVYTRVSEFVPWIERIVWS